VTLFLTLFGAGLLTILLPCILPLVPIVLGVSIAGRSKWRPLLTILGMLASFVGFTFLLLIVLKQFVEVADYIRIATFDALLLFGLGFLTHDRRVQLAGAALGGLFFVSKGWVAVGIAAALGMLAIELGGRAASRLQQWGTDIQMGAERSFGADAPLTAFVIGLTLGLVWVPCAGPALGFAFTLVREEPGLRAASLLLAYGLGTAVPLLLIGYGGQAIVYSFRSLQQWSGVIKQVAGVLLIFTALALQLQLFERAQIFLIEKTGFGDLGTRIEEKIFGENAPESMLNTPTSMFPKIARAPEFAGLGPWHNSKPLTMKELRGKVVLVDFWTYSCINCVRTLPYMRGYWEKFKDQPFVLVGIHTPEFVFEKSEKNVADAIKRHGITYPVAQDNEYGTWTAFANHYWPAKYLIDADGYIRYTHFGEGNYEETDLAIQSLLKEMGHMVGGALPKEEVAPHLGQSPETYLGVRSWPSFGNAQGDPTNEAVTYTAPSSMDLHRYYLVGTWQLADDERQVLRSDTGEIRGKFVGSEINLVLGLEPGAAPVQASVSIDGKHVKDFTVDRHDLFNVFTGPHGEHELMLTLRGRGLEGYAFTFGS
jgi:cytochrome c biogenesis protein CcdA/thiol-disulfide isomerase/thioredoxin